MANSLAKKVDIFFEKIVDGFDATNVSAKNCAQYKPNSGALAESGQTFHRPMPLMFEGTDGRDITNDYEDTTELTVPSTLMESHLRNIPLTLTGVDLNNPHIMQRMVEGTNKKLSNKLDVLVANEIATKGSLVVVNSGNIDSYDDAAEADALMLEQQCTNDMRCMYLNPRMAKNLAGDLAGRQTFSGKAMTAYERNSLPPIAGFDTFRVDYGKTLVGSAATGYLVNGANQNITPTAAIQPANELPRDNRTQTLAVDTGTGIAVGDVFTIDGVFAVGHVNKENTGQLKTFRVLEVNGGNLTIAPSIIPYDGTDDAQKQYANVTTTPADNAAITVLNTVTKPVSTFFEKNSVEIISADFDTEAFSATGKKVRKATTDSGIQIVMIADSNIDTLVAKYRTFVWANVEMLNYEHGGIMLEGQT